MISPRERERERVKSSNFRDSGLRSVSPSLNLNVSASSRFIVGKSERREKADKEGGEQKEWGEEETSKERLPKIVRNLIKYVLWNCIEDEGIFRISPPQEQMG